MHQRKFSITPCQEFREFESSLLIWGSTGTAGSGIVYRTIKPIAWVLIYTS